MNTVVLEESWPWYRVKHILMIRIRKAMVQPHEGTIALASDRSLLLGMQGQSGRRNVSSRADLESRWKSAMDAVGQKEAFFRQSSTI